MTPEQKKKIEEEFEKRFGEKLNQAIIKASRIDPMGGEIFLHIKEFTENIKSFFFSTIDRILSEKVEAIGEVMRG